MKQLMLGTRANSIITAGIVVLIILGAGYMWMGQPRDNQNGQPLPQDTMTDTTSTPTAKDKVEITTSKGKIVIALEMEKAPKTAGNFAKLVSEGYYNGIKVHRVVPSFVVQFGDPQTKTLPLNDPRIGSGGPGYAIPDEFHPELSNLRGTLSMANSGPNTGGSQVFINLVDNTFLDYNKPPLTSQHAVFGRIVEGMDAVEKLGEGDVIESAVLK